MKRLIVLLALSLLLSGCAANPDGSYAVSGSVKTENTNDGLEGVTLYFGPFGTAKSDAKGNWSKDGLVGSVSIVPITKGEWDFTPGSVKVAEPGKKINFIAQPKQYSLTIEYSGKGSVTKNIDQDSLLAELLFASSSPGKRMDFSPLGKSVVRK